MLRQHATVKGDFAMLKTSGLLSGAALMMVFSDAALALDSYRYLHVTIDTPWFIFLFLVPLVLSPLIIMAILYWYFTIQKNKRKVKVELEKVPGT